jgi:hypothetical protein
MTFMYLQPRILGLIAVLALAAIAPAAAGQYVGRCGGDCSALLAPTRLSPLDLRLRPYYIPRTPDGGLHDYRYDVKDPARFCGGCGGCGSGCSSSGDGACPTDRCSYPPEAAAAFDPCEFEVLGRIPNDSLLEGAAAAPPQ